MKPIKNAAQSVSSGTKKVIGDIKGAIQQRTKPTAAQSMQHSEKWNPRIDRQVRKAEDHFYKGDIHLATARSYVDQGGTVKKTAQEQRANKAQHDKHYAQSQLSYAKAIGAGTKANAVQKARDVTYHIPGIRGHR